MGGMGSDANLGDIGPLSRDSDFFVQKRIGKLFNCHKFRTMTVEHIALRIPYQNPNFMMSNYWE